MQRYKNLYHKYVAILANFIYRNPSQNLTVIGVTGTDGKTTTSNLVYHILKKNKKKVALISTTGAYINDETIDTGFHVTTPDSLNIQKLLRKIKMNNINYVVLEVTSHAIDQNRIHGIKFDYGILTNITHEHLDYHMNFKNYQTTKLNFIFNTKSRILNAEDNSYSVFIDKYDKKVISYGLQTGDYSWSNCFGDLNFENIPGEYNKYNILAAFALGIKIGLPKKNIIDAVKSFSLPVGRFEIVYDNEFRVINDFAHTANSLDMLLKHIKNNSKGRIIHVFGSAGSRDKEKRPMMGEISGNYSDVIVLTSEDPRNEDPNVIINQISKGIKKSVKVHKIVDRKEAIIFAINSAKKHDTVVVTGKGHEKSMNVNGKEYEWDENNVIRSVIKTIHENK